MDADFCVRCMRADCPTIAAPLFSSEPLPGVTDPVEDARRRVDARKNCATWRTQHADDIDREHYLEGAGDA